MTWTYTVTSLATSQLMQVRHLIGDVKQAEQLLQDEEINWELTQYPNIYGASAACCRALAAKFAVMVDTVQGDLRTVYSQRSRNYKMLAMDYEQRGFRGVTPYAGGISVSDKVSVETDTDRVPPSFNRGQFDDLLPVGPAGEQTPQPAMPDTPTSVP